VKGDFIMSEITEAKTSLKKIVSIIEEINGINTDSIPKIKEYPTNLLELIEQFENEKNSNVNTIESNTDEINSLKNKISQNNRDIIKFEEENEQLTKQRQELIEKIQAVQNDLNETNEKIKAKKEELDSRSQRLSELKERINELSALQDEFDEKMNQIESQLKAEFEKKEKYANSYVNRLAAMRALIKSKYISSQKLQFILSLQKDATLDLKNILLAIDMKEDTAKNILKTMIEENGPIEYDEAAGTVTLKEGVDFR
jgi:chromosome segregation ATPase